MIENLSSKIDSLSNGTPVAANAQMDEIDPVNPGSTTQLSEMCELPRHEGQHISLLRNIHHRVITQKLFHILLRENIVSAELQLCFCGSYSKKAFSVNMVTMKIEELWNVSRL